MTDVDTSIRRYTAGFLLHKTRVLLVRKSHPKWQQGMMNGIGGEIEPGEETDASFVREFLEETGWNLANWRHELFCTEYGPGYEVNFYRARLPDETDVGAVDWKCNDKGEELEWCEVNSIKYPVIGNLHWLLPMALDPRPIWCQFHTNGDIRKIVTW